VSRVVTFACWTIAIVLEPAALVLMLVALFGYRPHVSEAKLVATRAQIVAFLTALKTYQRETGDYPTTAQGLQALRTNPGVAGWQGPYLDKDIGPDPWGRQYLYRYRAEGVPEITSLGPSPALESSEISSLALDKVQKELSRSIPLLQLCLFLASALVFFGFPFLRRLLRRINARALRAKL
jgi:general secretion pathway protein G